MPQQDEKEKRLVAQDTDKTIGRRAVSLGARDGKVICKIGANEVFMTLAGPL
jgi:hypothetical protein